VGEPYEAMIAEAISGYRETMERLGITLLEIADSQRVIENLRVKNPASRLEIPSIETAMRYSARIKTEAVIRLGVYSVTRMIKRLFKKENIRRGQQKTDALKDSVDRIKRETERSVALNFKDYQENIKFQYIFKMTDAVSGQLYEFLSERFRSYTANVSTVIDQIKERHLDKEAARSMLIQIQTRSAFFTGKIERLKERIDCTFGEEQYSISNIQSRHGRKKSNIQG
jgi:hypothetical protein